MTQKSSFFIAGRHAVVGALKNPNRRVIKIFLTEESKKNIHKHNPHKNLLKDIKVFFKTKKELDKYCRSEDILHQGYVAEIEHLEKPKLKEFVKGKNNLTFVCLDEVTDPRNIGSLIRSAASFNIDGLIVKERHFPKESKLMYKSASGCVEHLNIFEVSNINTTLKFLRDKNNSSILNSLGRIYHEVRDSKNAEAYLLKAYKLNSDSYEIINNLAGFYREESQYKKSID